jgi:hypothetical protein
MRYYAQSWAHHLKMSLGVFENLWTPPQANRREDHEEVYRLRRRSCRHRHRRGGRPAGPARVRTGRLPVGGGRVLRRSVRQPQARRGRGRAAHLEDAAAADRRGLPRGLGGGADLCAGGDCRRLRVSHLKVGRSGDESRRTEKPSNLFRGLFILKNFCYTIL